MSFDLIASCERSIRGPEQQLEHSYRSFNKRCHLTFFRRAELSFDLHWWSCCHLWPVSDTYEGLSQVVLGHKNLFSLPLPPRSCYDTRSTLGLCPRYQGFEAIAAKKAFLYPPRRFDGVYLAHCSHMLDSSEWQYFPIPSQYLQSECLSPFWPSHL